MSRTHPWEVSDEWWGKVQPLIPAAPSHAKGGRPRIDDRRAFAAMIYVLRTGIPWNALPKELGASSTVHDRFQEWEKQHFFQVLWQAGLAEYDEVQGIEWEWQSVDGAMTKAPFGKDATGPNPTDRGKRGTKRSLLTDEAGIPLALVVDGANRHDVRLLCATLDGIVIMRASTNRRTPSASLSGCWLRWGSLAPRGREPSLSALYSQSWTRKAGENTCSWSSCSPMGGGTHAFLDQSLPSALGALGEESGELPRFSSPRLCSIDLC